MRLLIFFVVLQLETSLKLAQVEMYQSKLKERDRRKWVSRELGLVENFFKENTYNALTGKFVLQKPKKKDPKTEVLDRLKFVSSFLGAEEHRRMMANLSLFKSYQKVTKQWILPLIWTKIGITHRLTAEGHLKKFPPP